MQQQMARHAVKNHYSLSKNNPLMSLGIGPPFGYCLKLHSLCKLLHASALEPLVEILALTDIKRLELVTTINNGFDTDSGDSHASSNR